MNLVFVFIWMLFMHVSDDYFLQGILASMKQKQWWKDNCKFNDYIKYKYDYIMELIMHAISWTFCIMLPVAAYMKFNISIEVLITFIVNVILHGWVDNLKANKHAINLIQDQIIHIVQIIVTFCLLLLL